MENTIGYDESLLVTELGNSSESRQGSKCKGGCETSQVTCMKLDAAASVPATLVSGQPAHGSGPS